MMTVMGLHPQTQAILDLTASWGGRPIETLTAAEARAQRDAHLSEALAHGGTPEPVDHVEDRTIPSPDGDLPVRIYRPAGAAPLPVLIFYHGGGWIFGDLETMDRPCRMLANAVPCVVVSVGYRLAPEHKFPAPVEDAYAALNYVAAHGAEFGADAARIAVAGDSAGGNLAAAVCLMARDRQGPKVAFQLLVYPVTDYDDNRASMSECSQGFGLTRAGMLWFWEQYARTPEEARSPYASVINTPSCQGLPAALLITAEFDPLRDQGEAYAMRLAEAGVRVTITRYAGTIHGFYPMRAAIDASQKALAQSADALRIALQGSAQNRQAY